MKLFKMEPIFKKYFQYVLPASLIVLAITVYGLASQTWFNPTSGNQIAQLDNAGGFTTSGTGALNNSPTFALATTSSFGPGSYAGVITGGSLGTGTLFRGYTMTGGTLSGGTLTITEPLQGDAYKTLVISASAVTCTSSVLNFTLPTAFAVGSGTMLNTTGSSLGVILNGTSGTFQCGGGTGSSGVLIVGGR